MTLGRASAPTQMRISAGGRRCQAAPATVAHPTDLGKRQTIEALLDTGDRTRYPARGIDLTPGASGAMATGPPQRRQLPAVLEDRSIGGGLASIRTS